MNYKDFLEDMLKDLNRHLKEIKDSENYSTEYKNEIKIKIIMYSQALDYVNLKKCV